MRSELLDVNGMKYPVNIYFEQRDRPSVSIGRSINIRLPLSLNREEQFRLLMEMKSWARLKIEEKPEKFSRAPLKTYKDGDELRIGNENYILSIEFKEKDSSSAHIVGNTVVLSISSKLSEEDSNRHVSSLLSRCVARKRLPALHERISSLNAKHFNQKANRIFFKNNKSSWGSCSENGNINISTRLLFAPDDVLDYVCIHELAHLAEPNHSEQFWSIVQKAMPDYEEKKAWLRENGDSCGF